MTSLFLPDIGVTSDACDDKDSELLEVVFGSEINLHRVTGFKHLLPDYLQILLNLVTKIQKSANLVNLINLFEFGDVFLR